MAFLSKWQIRNLIYAWLVGLTAVFFSFIGLAFKTLIKGKAVWSVKPRATPPKCLSNPEYGHHHYAKLKDVKLHYVESGDKNKPLVIFLHGFPEFWYSWRHQLKAFKNKYWSVAVDMRGYGDSDKPSDAKSYDDKFLVDDVKDLIRALGRSSCILVAHDWGGVVGYLFAKRYPKMLEKLIILNSPHPNAWKALIKSSWKQFLKSWYVFFFQIPILPEIFLMTEDMVLFEKMYQRTPKEKAAITQQDIEAFKYSFASRVDWSAPINYYRRFYFNSYEIKKELQNVKIQVPALIIWGCDDLALIKDTAKASSEYFVDCAVKYVEDGGHFVQQDSAPVVNQYIEDFINKKR